MPELSIIIPIYNTPTDALSRCFASLDTLDGISYEALLVDDGSQPATGDFCRAYAQANPAFRYLPKENGGVSSARNFGLMHAQGQYVMFVDADDMLLGQAIDPSYLRADRDLVIFDMQLCIGEAESTWHALDRNIGAVSREALLYRLLTTKDLNSPCAKLFRRSVLEADNLRFNQAFITGEDWLFVSDFSLRAQSVLYVRSSCYRYFREEATGQSRLARFPDTMLQNQIDRFGRKQQIAAQTDWTGYSREKILSLAATEFIENLFNSASELLLAKVLTPQRKGMIRQAAQNAGPLLGGDIPKKTRLKYETLVRFPAALWVLASMRACYLKLKNR